MHDADDSTGITDILIDPVNVQGVQAISTGMDYGILTRGNEPMAKTIDLTDAP